MSVRAIRSGLTGARDGISAANKVVSGAKALDAAMDAANMSGIQRRVDAAARGVPPPESRMDRAVQGYAAGKTAHRMGSYFAHTNPRRAPGPRTAGSYAYQYGFGGSFGAAAAGSATTDQRELLARVRRQHAQIDAVRNQVHLGRYRNMAAPQPQAPRNAAGFVDEFATDEDLRRRARAFL